MRYPSQTIEKLKTSQTVTIAGLGDSLTYGWCAEKGYLDFLHDALAEKFANAHLVMLNRGIPGDTAGGGLSRLNDVIAANPDCVLIQFGLNDVFSGCPIDSFKQDMLRIIDRLSQETKADLVLTTSVWFDMPASYRYAVDAYRCIEEIAELRALPLVRLHAAWKRKIDEGFEQRRLVQADGVHPTSDGYRLMAEIIGEVFLHEPN